MRELPAGIETRTARPDEGLRVDAMIRVELERYREWAPDWELGPIPPDLAERLEENFRDPQRAWILLAETDGEIVGVVSLAMGATGVDPDPPPEGTVHLWQMFVRRDWQGQGLAGPLHDRALEEARRLGYTRLILMTPAGAAQARRFYEREGWRLSGREEPESGFGLPLVEYERPVA